MGDRKIFRCAIYTRKSSEEGLEQDFNSLEAQREACEAYIRSQEHEGWRLTPDRFDDGGFSGGNMDRPALRQLTELVKASKIDIIVVYKIDRLTRLLTDFAKLAEVLDKHGVSFVSVTQQFNTTTSMGRLMLNVLLSFAQFEREITGERIRDKIAASKRKGMWMGGVPPMGYDIVNRQLVVNESRRQSEEMSNVISVFLPLWRQLLPLLPLQALSPDGGGKSSTKAGSSLHRSKLIATQKGRHLRSPRSNREDPRFQVAAGAAGRAATPAPSMRRRRST